jgi:pyruvate formate lyase activating enzyme
MTFRGWQKTSLIEYPGKIATVVFAGGCNLRCPFCYNPDLVPASTEAPGVGEDTVLAYLRENRPLYQAVMVSGGEPTLDQSLPEFLRNARSLDLLTGIETNGSRPEMLNVLLEEGLVDFVAMDLKAPLDRESYEKAAGIRNQSLVENVKRSLGILHASDVDFLLRTTVVPGIHSERDIAELGRQIDGAGPHLLQSFEPGRTLDKSLRNIRPYPREVLADWQVRYAGGSEGD